MTTLFADTFYFLALLNADDEAHNSAAAFAADGSFQILTTTWILTELADALATTRGRHLFAQMVHDLEDDPQTQIIQSDPALWREGVELYMQRADKRWSLTDCISFIVMRKHGVTSALTGDHHFEQAGFQAILK